MQVQYSKLKGKEKKAADDLMSGVQPEITDAPSEDFLNWAELSDKATAQSKEIDAHTDQYKEALTGILNVIGEAKNNDLSPEAVKENSKAVKENVENYEALLKVQKAENDEAKMIAAWKNRNDEQKQYDELLKMMHDYYKTSQQLDEENLQEEYRINLKLLERRGAPIS